MTMNKTLKISVALIGILGVSIVAHAVCPSEGIPTIGSFPLNVTDPTRNATGAVLSLRSMSRNPKQLAEIIGKQEETEALIDGEESYVKEEGTGSAASGLEITAYDYVKDNFFAKDTYTPYNKLNNKIKSYMGTKEDSSKSLRKVILDEFYIENKADDNTEKRAEVQANRDKYLRTIAREYVRLGYNVQSRLSEDANAVVADLNGDGSIGVVSGADQTWKAVNKALLVDIALQIQLMELEAARFLSVQPLVMMDKSADS